jgi:hypothetical protein
LQNRDKLNIKKNPSTQQRRALPKPSGQRPTARRSRAAARGAAPSGLRSSSPLPQAPAAAVQLGGRRRGGDWHRQQASSSSTVAGRAGRRRTTHRRTGRQQAARCTAGPDSQQRTVHSSRSGAQAGRRPWLGHSVALNQLVTTTQLVNYLYKT